MNKIVFLIVFILCLQLSLGQINYDQDKNVTYQTGNLDAPFIRVSTNTGNKITGSIYLNEAWDQAIVNQGSKSQAKVLARFNAYHSEIEVLNGQEISALVPSDSIQVALNNKTFVPLQLPEKKKAIFVELLAEGHYGLYGVFDIKINKAASDAKLLNLESTDQAVIINTLYFRKKDALPMPLPSRKKDIEKKIPEEVRKLAAKEKLSFKKEKDIIALFKLLNTN